MPFTSRRLAFSLLLLLIGGSAAIAFDSTVLVPPEPPVVQVLAAPRASEPAPLGLDPDGREYSLQSNGSWRASGRPAKVLSLTREGQPDARNAEDRQDYGLIWARECERAAQTVVFTRKYYLPGPPKDFRATFGASIPQAIEKARVLINGIEAFSFTGNNHIVSKTETHYVDLFRFGQNIIQIEVTKAQQNGLVGRCRSAAGRLGISFFIEG